MDSRRFLKLALIIPVTLLIILALPRPLRGSTSGSAPEEASATEQGRAHQRRQRRHGQLGIISGRVVSKDGKPAPAAIVEILELGLSAAADQDGEFVIEDLPLQRLTLVAKAPAFFPSAPLKINLADQPEYELEFVLTEQVLAQSVVVTGTGTEHVAIDAPVRTQMVSALQCERNVSRTLAEALTSTVSGVRIEYTCQNCGAPAVRLNGLEGNYTQVLEDGLPTMSNVGMVYALDQLSADFFETIEVVKGGASALYGPNAVGGVINLIRKEPRYGVVQLDSQAGWHHGRPEQSLGLSAQSNKLPAGLSADFHFRGLRRTPIDRDGDGFTELGKRTMHGASGMLYRRFLNGSARLTLGGTVLGEFRRGGDNLHLKPEQTQITEMIESARFSGLLRWNHTPSAATFYTLSTGWSYLGRHTYYGTNFDPNAYGRTGNPMLVTDAQLGHQAGSHTLLIGWQLQREQVRDHILAYQRAFNRIFRDDGGYFQDEWRLGRNVVLVAGARGDRSNTLGRWVFSPRANVRVGFGEKWRWRFGASTGFRAPVIFEEDLHVAAVGGEAFLLENSPDLKEERSLSLTSSLDYAGTLRGLPLQVGITLFSTRLRDVHVFEEVAADNSGYRKLLRINGPGSRVRGLELDMNWRLGALFGLRAGASLQSARYDRPEPQFGSLRYLRTPNRYGFLGWDMLLPGGLSLVTTLDVTGSMLVPHYAGYIPQDRLEASKSFKVWNLVLDRTLVLGKNNRRKVRLYLKASNLLDDFQPDLDRGPLRDSSYFYGPGNMRQLIVGATFTFR